MKRIFLILTILSFAVSVSAQINEPFCCLKQGTELKYVSTTPKGKEVSTTVTVIDKATGANGNYEITQTSTVYSDGQPMTKPMTLTSKIENGNASVALGGGSIIDIEGFVPIIPSKLAVGDELACGEMIVYAAGIKTKNIITSNKCIAQEQVTTAAGTFDCFVVEQFFTVQIGPIKSSGSQKTWYARGVGNVKCETYDKKGKLSQVQTLASYK